MEESMGSLLRSLRSEAGLTQEQVAEAINISHPAYVRYENDQRTPKADIAIRLASFFGITVEKLLSGKDGEQESVYHPQISDDDIKFALFNGDKEITDAQFEEVKRFAQFIQEREKRK